MSVSFNGTSDYLTASLAHTAGDAMTMLAWVKPNSSNGVACGYGGVNGSVGDFYGLRAIIGDALYFRVIANSADAYAALAGLNNNAWNCCIGTTSGVANRVVRLNGSASSAETTSRSPATLTTFTIGARNWANTFDSFCAAKIAEVAIYSSVLNGTDLASLEAGRNPQAVSAGTLIWYARLYDTKTVTEVGVDLTANGGTIDTGDHPSVDAPPSGTTFRRRFVCIGA